MKILALDQSTKLTGYSLWEDSELTLCGLLECEAEEKNPIERMSQMLRKTKGILLKHKPDHVVLENVQFQNNYATFQQLSQLQGVLFALLFDLDIGFTIIEPSAWKKYFGVKGRKRVEQKASAIQIVKERYGIETSEDIADSIGIGNWATNNLKISK